MDFTELVAGFRGCAIASVADAVDLICGRRGYLHRSIKPRINDRKIVGPAVTVLEVPTDEVSRSSTRSMSSTRPSRVA